VVHTGYLNLKWVVQTTLNSHGKLDGLTMIQKMIIPPINGQLSLTWLETSLNMVYNRSFVSKTVLLVVVTSGQRENIASIRKVRVLLIHDLLLLAKVSLFRVPPVVTL
jgi:hypothetical protein